MNIKRFQWNWTNVQKALKRWLGCRAANVWSLSLARNPFIERRRLYEKKQLLIVAWANNRFVAWPEIGSSWKKQERLRGCAWMLLSSVCQLFAKIWRVGKNHCGLWLAQFSPSYSAKRTKKYLLDRGFHPKKMKQADSYIERLGWWKKMIV